MLDAAHVSAGDHVLDVAAGAGGPALTAARRTETLSLILYRQGAGTYLDVVSAQAAALQAERAAIILQARRLQASVDLVRALGGGWTGELANLDAHAPG
jgi:outer membrane protein TolC